MSKYRNRDQYIGGFVIGTIAFVMWIGLTEGSGEGSWIMPLFWAIVIGLGFAGLGGN